MQKDEINVIAIGRCGCLSIWSGGSAKDEVQQTNMVINSSGVVGGYGG